MGARKPKETPIPEGKQPKIVRILKCLGNIETKREGRTRVLTHPDEIGNWYVGAGGTLALGTNKRTATPCSPRFVEGLVMVGTIWQPDDDPPDPKQISEIWRYYFFKEILECRKKTKLKRKYTRKQPLTRSAIGSRHSPPLP